MDQLAIHGNHRGDLNHPLFSLALWGGGRGSLDPQQFGPATQGQPTG